ncbi:MAG: insulinase family protein [Flavobacteriales bacterium]|nr:insulinase family protein [Flavobacteriales bacterium]MCB9363076.1 insulinase family protein [Flavobacteriales bacterium]
MTVLDRKLAPKFKQVSTIHFLQPKTQQLNNGIIVHSISGGSQNILKIDFIFKAGIWHQNNPLVAKATNSLLKEGTKNYSAHDIAEGIDQFGAYFQHEVDYDNATLTVYTLSKYLENVLVFVKEILLSPKFDKNEFNTYKENSLERFKINQEKVSFLARNEFMKQLFGYKNPYGKIAKVEDFKNLSLSKIKEFYHHFYDMSNCEIVASGNVTADTFTSLNNCFGSQKIKTDSIHIKTQSIAEKKHTKKIHIEKAGALQSAIRIGKLMPNKLHPDYFKLQILSTILGGYFGSRLMKNIREDKGYTYGVGCGLLSLKNAGYFFISTEVGADVTTKAIKEIYKEINILQTEEVSQEELDLVKNYLLGNLLKSCDGPFKMASLFENLHFYGLDYSFYNDYVKTIKNITPKELIDIANQYFKIDTLLEVVVGKTH